jgi:hypothetical protein
MQGKLPFFPPHTKLINSSVGFGEHDGMVYYFHSGNGSTSSPTIRFIVMPRMTVMVTGFH